MGTKGDGGGGGDRGWELARQAFYLGCLPFAVLHVCVGGGVITESEQLGPTQH